MRLVTWNCCGGRYERKVPLAGALAPDVMVVQEVARPAAEAPGCLWTGSNPNKGMAVVTGGGYSARLLPAADGVPAYHIPVQVGGPVGFLLISVWSQKAYPYPYVRGVYRAVELNADAIRAQPTVLMGDLNSNTFWDRDYRRGGNHTQLVGLLGELGLVSAYHVFHGEEQGAETRPTFYLHHHREKPFHIDYCFIPREWVPRMRDVRVATFEEWAGISDHRPLVVEIADDGALDAAR